MEPIRYFPPVVAFIASAAGIAMPSALALAQTPDAPSPATGHAEVIAQGLIELDDGEYHWSLDEHELADMIEIDLAATAPTLLLARSGHALRVTPEVGPGTRLAPGEATHLAAATFAEVAAEGDEPSMLTEFRVDAGPGDGAFAPGAGVYDLDLVRDVLATGEALTARAGVSALVYVTTGAVVDEPGDELTAGEGSIRAGDITLTSTGTGPAHVVVAVLNSDEPSTGPTVPVSDVPSAPAPTTPADPPSTSAPDQPSATYVTVPQNTYRLDSDQDGLYDDEEMSLGTDPANADTDGDGYGDGHEVNITGTSPTMADTDGDGLDDHREVQDYQTDALNPDTDGDGFSDGDEVQVYFTDPFDPADFPQN